MALNQTPANPSMMGLPATIVASSDQNLHAYSFPPSSNNKITKPKKTQKKKQSLVSNDNTFSIVPSVTTNFATVDKCETQCSKSSFGESPNFSLLLSNMREDIHEIIDENTMSELSNQSNTSPRSMEGPIHTSNIGRRYSFLDVDMDSILKFKLN